MSTQPSKELETFPNPSRAQYLIRIECPEFTCICPKTGQPDFADFVIELVPSTLCLETKSLKLYLWSFRNEGAFHEKVTNDIADAIALATTPIYVRITGHFWPRGGISSTITTARGSDAAIATRPACVPEVPRACTRP